MVASSPPFPVESPPAVFTPGEALAHAIVRDLAEPTASLASVAAAHNIPLATLAPWLTTPRARDLMLTIERGACTHTRLAASLRLPAAVGALVHILDDYRAARRTSPTSAIGVGAASFTPSSAIHSPSALRDLPPAAVLKTDADSPSAFSSLRLELRHADIARKAAYDLFRLSRITPLTDDQIALAADRAAAKREARPNTQPDRQEGRFPAATSSSSPSPSPSPLAHSSLSSSPVPSSPSPLSPRPPAALRVESSSPLPSSDSPSSPRPSSASRSLSPSRLGDSFAERTARPYPRGGPQDRRGLHPADLIRAATGPPVPVGASP